MGRTLRDCRFQLQPENKEKGDEVGNGETGGNGQFEKEG